MTATLFHVSEDGAIAQFEPRPLPRGAVGLPLAERVVWAIDAEHLHNYLLPRDCPRVTFYARPDRAGAINDEPLLAGTTALRVIVVESAWLDRIRTTPLFCYEFRSDGFARIDANAGYFVSHQPVTPTGVRRISDPLAELARHDVELRVMPSLWKLHDAVIATPHVSYSIIRMRKRAAAPDVSALASPSPVDTPAGTIRPTLLCTSMSPWPPDLFLLLPSLTSLSAFARRHSIRRIRVHLYREELHRDGNGLGCSRDSMRAM
jgi:hypothetical protein